MAEKLTNTHINAKEQEMALEKEANERLQQIDSDIDTIQKGTDRELEHIRQEASRIEELIELERKEKAIMRGKDNHLIILEK